MAAGRLSSQDRKDLERFTKFLIYKSLQIVVQSRLGEKIQTQSKSISSGADWFNIAIKDIPDVQNETKRLLGGQTFGIGQTISLEISLKTNDGETMLLEVWHVTQSDDCDLTMRTAHTTYYRMSVALKSVFSVSRVTPAYKLSRQQTLDNYVVCYKMFIGEPKYYHLGDGYKTAKVASVPMITGTVKIHVSYRTKLQISPQSSNCYKGFDLKTDHFLIDKHVCQRKSKPCKSDFIKGEACTVDGDTSSACVQSTSKCTMTHGDCVRGGACVTHDETDIVNGHSSAHHFVPSQPIDIAKQQHEARPDNFMPNRTPDQCSPPVNRKTSAFAKRHTLTEYSMDLDDVPFESLLHSKDADVRNGLVKNSNDCCNSMTVTMKCPQDLDMSSTPQKDTSHMIGDGGVEDFVMLDLKTPFAASDSGSELNQFYRDCQTAPTLSMFSAESDIDVALNTITQQLHMFETSMKDFDHFVSTLQDSD